MDIYDSPKRAFYCTLPSTEGDDGDDDVDEYNSLLRSAARYELRNPDEKKIERKMKETQRFEIMAYLGGSFPTPPTNQPTQLSVAQALGKQWTTVWQPASS